MDRDKQAISINHNYIKVENKPKNTASPLERDSTLFPGQLSPSTLSSKKASPISSAVLFQG